jgi:hypothetical protein
MQWVDDGETVLRNVSYLSLNQRASQSQSTGRSETKERHSPRALDALQSKSVPVPEHWTLCNQRASQSRSTGRSATNERYSPRALDALQPQTFALRGPPVGEWWHNTV